MSRKSSIYRGDVLLQKWLFHLHSTNVKVLVQRTKSLSLGDHLHVTFWVIVLHCFRQTFGVSAESSRSPTTGPFSPRTELTVLILTFFTVSRSAVHKASFTRLGPCGPFHLWVFICWLWRELIRVRESLCVCLCSWREAVVRTSERNQNRCLPYLRARLWALPLRPFNRTLFESLFSREVHSQDQDIQRAGYRGPQSESSVFGFQV